MAGFRLTIERRLHMVAVSSSYTGHERFIYVLHGVIYWLFHRYFNCQKYTEHEARVLHIRTQECFLSACLQIVFCQARFFGNG